VNQLSPEQLLSLQLVVDNIAADISATLGIPIERAEDYLSRVSTFVQAYTSRLENMVYVLSFVPGAAGRTPLDLTTVLSSVRSGKTVLYVDEELRLVKAVEGGTRVKDCLERSREEHSFVMRIERTYSQEVLCGDYLDEVDVCNPGAEPPIGSPLFRKMREFKQIAKEHFDIWITRQQSEKFWSDRRRRILSAGIEGTEKIFHQSLFNWLKMFVRDRIDIYAEPTTMGQDKTDIVVVTIEGSYVIEVKWMGINENKQSYDEDRIDEGLVQVGLYLDNDNSLVCGHLVIYDGRSHATHQNACQYTKTRKHLLCHDPLIFWLVSETPSETGPRIVAGKPA
jgi:hypothetical protein